MATMRQQFRASTGRSCERWSLPKVTVACFKRCVLLGLDQHYFLDRSRRERRTGWGGESAFLAAERRALVVRLGAAVVFVLVARVDRRVEREDFTSSSSSSSSDSSDSSDSDDSDSGSGSGALRRVRVLRVARVDTRVDERVERVERVRTRRVCLAGFISASTSLPSSLSSSLSTFLVVLRFLAWLRVDWRVERV